MTQVLARPEFAGWTRAEWCLEMIQTALGYYTRPRPAAGPDRKQAPAAEPEAATEHAPAGEAVAEPAPVPDEPEPVLAAPEPEPEPAADEPESEADEPKRPAQAECPHPADARDYQSGTCAACGAILWD